MIFYLILFFFIKKYDTIKETAGGAAKVEEAKQRFWMRCMRMEVA
ncbi:hypothetical protein CGSMWGv00703Bmash_03985 [Gardnerella pickettii 00703Bmash]|nr:hypothetical protein CGSMWGv00703Bmash_03985 [Gardnerella pickettii 00703Bmash]